MLQTINRKHRKRQQQLQNLLQLPWERKIPPFYDKKEFPETSMISMIFDRIGKKININEYNVGYNYFMFDYDHDQILDVLFIMFLILSTKI